jgi:hypothetical protein
MVEVLRSTSGNDHGVLSHPIMREILEAHKTNLNSLKKHDNHQLTWQNLERSLTNAAHDNVNIQNSMARH